MGCNSIISERKVSVYEGEGMITFRKITEFPRGTLVSLLRKGYSFEPRFERDWLEQWKEFDDFFYDHPEIADFSGFMTVMDEKPIGFVSWNPTQLPELVEIGHNCIAAEYKGKGYGKQADAGGGSACDFTGSEKNSRLHQCNFTSGAAYL